MDFILDDNEFEEQLLILKYIEEKNIIKKAREKKEKLEKEKLQNKIKTYPKIPNCFFIQKHLLNIKTRNDEIIFIDNLIERDKTFLTFLFKNLLDSFSGVENENFIKYFYVKKYQGEFSVYNCFKNKLINGYNSLIFKDFLINYFKYKTENNINEKIIQMLLLSTPTFFYSTNFLCNLTKNIIGIDFLWNKINSFLY